MVGETVENSKISISIFYAFIDLLMSFMEIRCCLETGNNGKCNPISMYTFVLLSAFVCVSGICTLI